MSLQKLAAQFGFDIDAKSVDSAIKSVNSIDREITRLGRGMENFIGLFGAGALGSAIFSSAKSVIDEFAKEEQAVNKLSQSLSRLGITDQSVVGDLKEFAISQARVSMATHDEILAAERSLVTRGLWGEQLKQAVKAALDLSTKTGDLASATEVVGKAFQGVTARLANFGITIDASTPKAQVFSEVLKQINAHFGGAAAAEMNGYSGQVHKLSEQWDELKESLGKILVGPASGIVKWLQDAAQITETLMKSGSKESQLDRLYESLNAWNERVKELESPGKSFFSKMLNRDAASIAYAKKQVEEYTKEIQRLQAEMSKGSGGSKVATQNTGSPATEIHIPKNVATEIDSSTSAWLRSNQAMQTYYTAWLGNNAKFVESIRPTEELRAKVNDETWKKIESNWKSAEQKNKATVEDMKTKWEQGSHTISGGFAEAMILMEQSAGNWKDNFTQVANSSIGPAKTAFHDFFTSTSAGFLNLESLVKSVFQGILDAFLNMLEEMAAKAAIYGIFSMFSGGSGLLGGSLKKFLGFAEGGLVPGIKGAAVPAVVHGGEYVLPASVVDSIKAGRAPAAIPAMAGASSGGASVSITQHINVGASDSADIGKLCQAISEATRNGLRQAGEMANVITKVGTKKAGVTAL